MKYKYSLLIIILCVIAFILLYVYTNANTNNYIAPYNPTAEYITSNEHSNILSLHLFYTSWCGASKAFFPEWNKLKQMQNNNLNMVMVDCDKEKDLCSANNITAYPTIVLQKNNEMVRYVDKGPRTAENVMSFVRENE